MHRALLLLATALSAAAANLAASWPAAPIDKVRPPTLQRPATPPRVSRGLRGGSRPPLRRAVAAGRTPLLPADIAAVPPT